MTKIQKIAASIAAQMAEEFRGFYFKNGNPRKMRALELERAWNSSPVAVKYNRLCKVATKCGDWKRNGEFNRFFQSAFLKALKKN